MKIVTNTTHVIFRKWKDTGDVIALFLTDPGTNDPYTCSSYMRIGQHASADPNGVMRATVPATRSEYRSLRQELESAPYRYKLRVMKRNKSEYVSIRREQIARVK